MATEVDKVWVVREAAGIVLQYGQQRGYPPLREELAGDRSCPRW